MRDISSSIFSSFGAAPAPLRALAVVLLCSATACGRAMAPMPAATAHDPELEEQAKRAVYSARDFTGSGVVSESDKILDARIVSDFDVEQNELTGAPTKRSVEIALVIKEENGECHWVKVLFTQQHMGGGRYGGLHGEMPLQQRGMECPAEGAKPADAASPAQPVAVGAAQVTTVSTPAGPPTPEEQAQIDALAEGLGPNAASECKAYIRQVCTAQSGPTRMAICKAYADSMRQVANTPGGASACQGAMGGESPH